MILECIRCIFICIILISCWNIIHKPAQNGGFFLSFLCQDSLDWSELLQTPILPEMIGRCVMLRWKLHCFFWGVWELNRKRIEHAFHIWWTNGEHILSTHTICVHYLCIMQIWYHPFLAAFCCKNRPPLRAVEGTPHQLGHSTLHCWGLVRTTRDCLLMGLTH